MKNQPLENKTLKDIAQYANTKLIKRYGEGNVTYTSSGYNAVLRYEQAITGRVIEIKIQEF